ncbi:uncharacterized protein [Centruroides vittatus]|uniref:uncharacterized protein n=1 Tax=Centruroides vittatus TaxID=120091 RepID=UPI00350F4788
METLCGSKLYPLLICGLLFIVRSSLSEQVDYDVTCSGQHMKVTINLEDNGTRVYLDKMKGYSACQPKLKGNVAVFKLSLTNIYKCGTIRMYNKLTGFKIYYHRIILERKSGPRDVLLVKCVLPADGSRYVPHKKSRRDVLPGDFYEPEFLNITGSIVKYAPVPYLNLAIRQNGRVVDAGVNVQPGTPLEMVVYLDEKSAPVYGLLASYLKVTDNTPKHEEVIVMNGCSIDQYIFGNFETPDDGNTLSAKFRAFKFPETNYVLFVGTVNICLQRCKGVPCGNGKYGFGRRKRDVPSELPNDTNRLYEVEMTTVLKVEYSADHFRPKKDSLFGNFGRLPASDGSPSPSDHRLPAASEAVPGPGAGISPWILVAVLWVLSLD